MFENKLDLDSRVSLVAEGDGKERIGFQVQLPLPTSSSSLNGMVKCVFLNNFSGLLGGTGLWQLSPASGFAAR